MQKLSKDVGLYSYPVRQALSLFPFYKWGN